MTETFLEIMRHYPLLSCWDSGKRWSGFVDADNELVRLTILVPNYPSMEGAAIHGGARTQMLCQSFSKELSSLLSQAPMLNLVKFLDELLELVKSRNLTQAATTKTLETKERVGDQFYTTLMKELEEIGYDKVVHLSDDYREVHVNFTTEEGREHLVKYQLQSKYPNIQLKVNLDLPEIAVENVTWPNRIMDAQRQIAQQLVKLNQFWDEMDNLDSKVKVVDPLKPNRSHCYRRIALNERINLRIDVNPLKPRSFPEINLTGPQKMVEELEANEAKNCKKWDDEFSLVENLELLLESKFMEKSEEQMDQDDDSLKCIVCLTYELEGKVPDRQCECGSHYHNQCLYELFKSEYSTSLKRSVDCPMCSLELKIEIVAFPN